MIVSFFFFLVHIENTVKESETHFLLDLDFNAYKFFLSEAYFFGFIYLPVSIKRL